MLPSSLSYSLKRILAKMWATPLLRAPRLTHPRVAGTLALPNLMGFHQGGPLSRSKNSVSNSDSFDLRKTFLCVQVVFKCLLVEKLKVERKEAISKQMSDHPFLYTPASGYRVPGAPTHILRPHTSGLTVLPQQLVSDP